MADAINDGRLPSTPDDRVRFGKLLLHTLRLAGLTQEQLADDLSVGPPTVSGWIHGRRWTDPVAVLHVLRAIPVALRSQAIRQLVDAVFGPVPGRWATDERGIELHIAIPAGAVALGRVAEILADGQVSPSEAPHLRELARQYREHAATFEAAANKAEGRV